MENEKKSSMASLNNDNAYRRSEDEMFITGSHKTYTLNLKKCIPSSYDELVEKNPSAVNTLSTFIVTRKAYTNNAYLVCNYIDWFIEYYDTDKYLPIIYMQLKQYVDNSATLPTTSEFINKLIKCTFLNKATNFKKKLYQFVEDSYDIDITTDVNGRRFDKKDDFTNNDGKKFLAISLAFKLLIPILGHYSSLASRMYDKPEINYFNREVLIEVLHRVADYKFPARVAHEYDTTTGDELLCKLYKFTLTTVNNHYKTNSPMWEHQAALFAVTPNTKLDETIVSNIIGDTLFKAKFGEPIINYLASSVRGHLQTTVCVGQYNHNPVLIDTSQTDNPEESSGLDRYEQSLAKIDETIIVKTDYIIDNKLNTIIKEFDISEEEIEFYTNNMANSNVFMTKLLNLYWANEFSGFTELKNTNSRHRAILMIIAKHRLKAMGFKEFPYLISATPIGKTTNRTLRSLKFTNKIKTSEIYDRIMSKKYSIISSYDDSIVINMISAILNNSYTYLEYDGEYANHNGEIIEFTEDIISDEILMFIDLI